MIFPSSCSFLRNFPARRRRLSQQAGVRAWGPNLWGTWGPTSGVRHRGRILTRPAIYQEQVVFTPEFSYFCSWVNWGFSGKPLGFLGFLRCCPDRWILVRRLTVSGSPWIGREHLEESPVPSQCQDHHGRVNGSDRGAGGRKSRFLKLGLKEWIPST